MTLRDDGVGRAELPKFEALSEPPTQEKPKDEKLSDDDYAMVQQQLVLMAALIVKLPLDKFLERIERAETVGWFIDPTLYREAGPNLENLKKLASTFRGVKSEVLRQIAEKTKNEQKTK